MYLEFLPSSSFVPLAHIEIRVRRLSNQIVSPFDPSTKFEQTKGRISTLAKIPGSIKIS